MPYVTVITYAVEAIAAAGAVYSAVEANRASRSAAATSIATADYNARVDRADAAQIDLDARANIEAMRKDASVYMSRQAASYAGAGVSADSGSPLAVQAVTAGRFVMRQQQAYLEAEAKQRRYYSAAKAGIAESAAQAEAYRMQGTAALLNGAGRVASMVGGAYQSGMFGGGGTPGGLSPTTNNLSAGLGGIPGEPTT